MYACVDNSTDTIKSSFCGFFCVHFLAFLSVLGFFVVKNFDILCAFLGFCGIFPAFGALLTLFSTFLERKKHDMSHVTYMCDQQTDN